MRVFLHIGAPRTGTTSFQELMQANRQALVGQGFHYSQIGGGAAAHVLAFSLMDRKPTKLNEARFSRDEAWSKLQSSMARRPETDCMIISSEAFSGLSEEACRFVLDFFKGHDLTIAYVARDAASWHASMCRQQIRKAFRTHWPKPFRGPADTITNKHLAGWRAAGAPVQVLDYDPNTTSRLCALAGINEAGLTPLARRNTRLPDDVLEQMMAVNRLGLPPKENMRRNQQIEAAWIQSQEEGHE